MITIRRLRCAAIATGLTVAVSVVSILPRHVLAQAGVADDAAGSSGTAAGADIGAAPLTGSRLHAEPQGEAAAVSQSAPEAVSQPGPAIHAEMAQTTRSGRKPAGSVRPVTMTFKPATAKPLPEAAGADVAGREPAAEQATEPSRPPGTMPGSAEVPQEAVVARLPDRTAGDMAARGAAAGKTIEGDMPVVTEQEANGGEQQAALPPAPAPAQPSPIAQLAFAPETATLSAEAKAMLKDLALRFPAHDEGARLQLMAYASGEGMSASKARRLSLARALSVREYLIANGIDGTRMDVRALGDEAARLPGGSPAGSPANRVDIAMIRR